MATPLDYARPTRRRQPRARDLWRPVFLAYAIIFSLAALLLLLSSIT